MISTNSVFRNNPKLTHILQNSLGINPWVAHANKDIFGDDAGQFRPERWLASKEATQRMDRYWLLVSTRNDVF